jgi:hypothetical protein
MTSTAVELLADATPQVRRAVAFWQLPARLRNAADSYIDKGQVDLEAVLYACQRLEAVGVDPIDNLPDTYVIRDEKKGTYSFGLYGKLQRALLPRAGYRINVKESDDVHATGTISAMADGWESPPFTVTIDDTDIQVYAKRGAKGGEERNANYRDKPSVMLYNRLSSKLIDLYAGEALRNVARAAGFGHLDSGPAPHGEGGQTGPEYRDDGSRLPDHLREPPCPPELRADLIARLGFLQETAPEHVRALGERIRTARIPNLRSGGDDFKLAHGWLLDLLFKSIEASLSDPPGMTTAPGTRHPAEPPGGSEPDDVPSHVYDDAPEARGYAPDDPGRPFT